MWPRGTRSAGGCGASHCTYVFVWTRCNRCETHGTACPTLFRLRCTAAAGRAAGRVFCDHLLHARCSIGSSTCDNSVKKLREERRWEPRWQCALSSVQSVDWRSPHFPALGDTFTCLVDSCLTNINSATRGNWTDQAINFIDMLKLHSSTTHNWQNPVLVNQSEPQSKLMYSTQSNALFSKSTCL